MRGLLYFLVLSLSLLSKGKAPDPMPTTARTCGDGNRVVTTTTLLHDSTVDDSQIVYVDNTKIVFLKVFNTDTFTTDVYRSVDYGKNWVLQTTPDVLQEYNGEGIVRIFSARPNKNEDRITLYLLSYTNKLWVTSDAGETYQYWNNVPPGVSRLYTHDFYPGMALARRVTEFGKDHEIMLLTEFGKTWAKIGEIPSWARITWSTFPKTNPQRIYFQVRKGPQAKHEQYTSALAYSDDFMKTVKELPVPNVLFWYLLAPERLVAVSCVEPDTCRNKKMYLSEDAGATFHVASFPDHLHRTKNETGVFPYEVTDDIIWAFVDRNCQFNGGGICYGDLYHSYAADKEFTLSLRYLNPYDFTKYESLDGIYIGNQYVTVDNEVADENDIRTVITFNKGGSWEILPAPEKDANNQPTNCFVNEGCSLHLHGFSDYDDYWDFFYSVPNAIGVMLAGGNIGTALANKIDEVNLYYSRNGGMTWQEVRNGRWITEIGNHGTAIVAAKIGVPTSGIIYTIDEGDSWVDCAFGDIEIDVRNIRVSKGWDTSEFILYGHKGADAYVVHINMTGAYDGKCGPSDFEIWSPRDEHGECFMGRHTQYERRAVGKKCFLDEEHIHKTVTSNCTCTEWDYECSECYYRAELGSPCQLECQLTSGSFPAPPAGFCDKSNETHPLFYEVDTGYEVIDEDTCDPNLPGATKPKAVVSCEDYKLLNPGPDPFIPLPSKKTVLYVLVFVGLLLLIGAGSYYLFRTNERFANFVSETFGIKNEERDLSFQQVHGQTLVSSDEEVGKDEKVDLSSDSSS